MTLTEVRLDKLGGCCGCRAKSKQARMEFILDNGRKKWYNVGMKKLFLFFMVAAFCAAGFAYDDDYSADYLSDLGAETDSTSKNRAMLDVGGAFFYAKRHSREYDIPNIIVRGFGPGITASLPFSQEGRWGMDLGLSSFINKEANFVYERVDGESLTPINVYSPNFGFRFSPAIKYMFLNESRKKFSAGISLNFVYYTRKIIANDENQSILAGIGASFDYKMFVSDVFYIKLAVECDADAVSYIIEGNPIGEGDDLTIFDTFAVLPQIAVGFRF